MGKDTRRAPHDMHPLYACPHVDLIDLAAQVHKQLWCGLSVLYNSSFFFPAAASPQNSTVHFTDEGG
jgi:hypothetical protein